MSEYEYQVVCAAGHRTYERVHDVSPEDTRWPDCECGAPRLGHLLPPVTFTAKPDQQIPPGGAPVVWED